MNQKLFWAVADFAVRLLQSTYDANNTLISPLSLLSVLAMAQLGARGDTKEEFDKVIGVDTLELVELLKRMPMAETEKKSDGLRRGNKHTAVNSANALWLNDNGKVHFNPNFLHYGKVLFHTDVQTLPFDGAACDVINQWAREKTNGQIPHVVDSLSEDMVMFLANALCFDGKWAQAYQPSDVKQRIFTGVDGKERMADFMESQETYYLHDHYAKGFIKNYCGGRYAFATLLPDQGVSLREYIECLSGKKLHLILDNPLKHKVETRMPKFEVEQRLELKEPLMRMGLGWSFLPILADFSGIATPVEPHDSLYIDNVWQINKIKVNEEGTQAVSLTGMDMICLKSCTEPERYQVYLDRPFLYMIIDKETNLPLFIGTVDAL